MTQLYLKIFFRLFLLVRNFGAITAQEFSSNLSAANRQTILNEFKCGHIQIIICSDAMSRGLDVPSVKYVISYDPPVSSKTYVHRIGRTARAGNKGWFSITKVLDYQLATQHRVECLIV